MEIVPNSAEDFARRLEDLIREGAGYGIDMLAVLQSHDPLSRSGLLRRFSMADPIRQIGMAQFALWQLQDEIMAE